jgi:hypothetical protein
MMATSVSMYTTTTSLSAAQRCGGRMPFAMPAAKCSRMSAPTGIFLLQTDVITSVSLFVLGLVPLLLVVGLVVIISLLLTCLTRLVTLECLVGLRNELTASTVQGA